MQGVSSYEVKIKKVESVTFTWPMWVTSPQSSGNLACSGNAAVVRLKNTANGDLSCQTLFGACKVEASSFLS